tara:strand:+ start:195 stop:566 length:372 start_codon:yes stop_codon:yes gene_type:complete
MSGKQNFTISLNNIIVYGFHGVHQEEKTLGQRFEIDLEFRLANPSFPWKDEERATVSYVNAHNIVKNVCAEKSFNLIETLGNRIIEEMRSRYSIDLIIVRVRKPSVPIQGILDYVEVEVEWHA